MYKTISNGYQRSIEVRSNGIRLHDNDNEVTVMMAVYPGDKKEILNAMAEIWTEEFKEVMEEFDERFKKYYYKLPEAFGNGHNKYLNEDLSPTPGVEHKYFLDSNTAYADTFKTKFTRQEFAKIVEEFPEYSIMVEEEIKEDN